MQRFREGDEVVLRIEEGFGYDHKVYNTVSVTVIGTDHVAEQHLCYVLPYVTMPNLFKITRTHMKHYAVHPKFLGEQGCFITTRSDIVRVHEAKPGATCDNCGEFFEYSQRDENGDFDCRACRLNPYR